MLSKKMAVSLTSLIIIFAFAFMVPSALARFKVTLDKSNDISSDTGDLEMRHPGEQGKITFTLEFAKAVYIPAKKVMIGTYNKAGTLLTLEEYPKAAETAADASRRKTYSITIVSGEVVTVRILIEEDAIASADPFDDAAEKNEKFDATIRLIGADDGKPTVYYIHRAVDDDQRFAKISPDTDPTVEVRVTLSELPKEFTKDHISATNATVTSVRQLLNEWGTPRQWAIDYASRENKLDTRQRMKYDEDIPVDKTGDAYMAAAGTPPVVRLEPVLEGDGIALRNAKVAARKDYGGLHRAINEAKILTGTAYKYKFIPALEAGAGTLNTPGTITDTTNLNPDAVDKEFGMAGANLSIGWLLKNYMGDATENAMDAPSKPGGQVNKPTPPDPSGIDFSNDNPAHTAYDLARTKYAADFEKYRKYANAKSLYDKYMDAMRAEQRKDHDKRAMEYDNLTEKPNFSIPTGPNNRLYPYLVTLTPDYKNTDPIVVSVKAFEDRYLPTPNMYTPPSLPSRYREGIDKLTIEVAKAKTGSALVPGIEIPIAKDIVIPDYLIVAKNTSGSAIRVPTGHDAKKAPENPPREPFGLTYNLIEGNLQNLESILIQGATIDIVGPKKLVISEIMWGTDASLHPDVVNSQYIELRNLSGAPITAGDKEYKLMIYPAGVTPPDKSVAANNIQDRVGTIGDGGYWSIIDGMHGQSGRTGIDEAPGDVIARTPTLSLISMQRVIDAAGTVGDGTMKDQWAASIPPGVNFDPGKQGIRIGSPGRAPDMYPTAPTPEPEPIPTPTVPVAKATDIMVTEIMVDTNNGRLPQWIELTHVGMGKVSLSGWEMVIDNAIDADVLGGGGAITVSLGDVTLDVSKHTGNTGDGQSVLVAAWPARRASSNIRAERVINLATELNQKSRYQLLSYKGFRITLAPPRTGATIDAFGDIVGNLHEDWEIPMAEGTRSSMIRREMDNKPNQATHVASMNFDGTDAKGWILASATSLIKGQQSYYGADEDAGTPGYDAGGPLPVELSHFRPTRDKATGQVVITWATQSELNNAGFFIKRSNQRNGKFTVINPTMVPGAGTTSEKQFYTYTDTTAQPNVVYYYQIEDVSLDGNRQLLTRGIRLKGHIGAAGKATLTWGELKTSHE